MSYYLQMTPISLLPKTIMITLSKCQILFYLICINGLMLIALFLTRKEKKNRVKFTNNNFPHYALAIEYAETFIKGKTY